MTAINTKSLAPRARVQAATLSLGTATKSESVIAIGYLRAFVTLLVVAHHALLAYHPYVPPAAASLATPPMFWQTFPMTDPQRWPGIELFTGLNDTFFMSLMFLLSGLFVWTSLERKGSRQFLRDRVLRLGLPFAIAVSILAPLTYYASYLATGADPSPVSFGRQWLAVGIWPAGPAWFLWLLLAFDVVAVTLYSVAPNGPAVFERLVANAARRPIAFFGVVIGLSAVAYIPLSLVVGPTSWSVWGPFAFQTSRLFHYLAYFLVGAVLGHYGVSRGLLARDGNLARRWWLWVVTAVIMYGLSVVVFIASIMAQSTSPVWGVINGVNFVLVCAATSFACLSVFVRFAQRRGRLLDCLRDNAYGIFLIHYVAVTWLQLTLLNASLPAPAKGLIVFIGAVTLTWIVIAGLRRIPAVARVI